MLIIQFEKKSSKGKVKVHTSTEKKLTFIIQLKCNWTTSAFTLPTPDEIKVIKSLNTAINV